MTTTILGHAVQRREDPGFLTGETKYLEDVEVDGALHAVFVRSTAGHAVVTGVDVSEAVAMPGVHAAFTAADLDLAPADPAHNQALVRPYIASDRVRYVGEPLAVVLAETRTQAVDAAELVVVDYEPLPAVVGILEAMEDDAPLLFPDHGSNVVVDGGRPKEGLFDEADVVVSARFHNQKVAPAPLEGNGCVAIPEAGGGLTVWASTQSVFNVRSEVCEGLGLDPANVRVRTAAVGGGFGAKGGCYPEHVVIAALAHRVERPVRWHETRSENMVVMTHGRGQVQDVELGAKRDGTIVALRARIVADCGAYAARGTMMPMVTRFMASGAYRIPAIDFRAMGVVTNTTPTGPYRGAGRPEAAALIERAMDVLAAELDMDPVELRRRNLLTPDAFPYTTPTRAVYDSGNYEQALDDALRIAGYDDVRAEQAARRTRDDRLQLGVGVASYVEVSGMGSEYGAVRVEDDGTITVVTGSSPHGQGHETVWAQIASSVLGVPMDDIRVVHSDTATVPRGVGTFGSRSLQLAGVAVSQASEAVLEQARQIAASLLEADPADIVAFEDGRLGVAGVPTSARTWAELVAEAPLFAEADFEQQGTFPSGAHVAVVEVDVETGSVELLRIVAVDDCGRIINPLLAEGQVHGGIAQGVAQALFESVEYDPDGTPRTATLADYCFPSAADLPSFETAHVETAAPGNPLGAKGIGESGTTGSTAAVWNAVVDALSPYGVRHLDPPFTPERVWQAIQPA